MRNSGNLVQVSMCSLFKLLTSSGFGQLKPRVTTFMCINSLTGARVKAQTLFKFTNISDPCGTNQEWKPCATVSCADVTCWKLAVGPECTGNCNYGCFCSEGFYRDGESDCVPLSQCPPGPSRRGAPAARCGPNEEWKICLSSMCAETTCERRTIVQPCRADCRTGCYCSDGFFRNVQGDCVTENQCPSQQ
uniref:TIL domain-containing protein n=1 Tax=Amblyomma maculatum TaxID=34609 RepID=G3MP61_AMBMU